MHTLTPMDKPKRVLISHQMSNLHKLVRATISRTHFIYPLCQRLFSILYIAYMQNAIAFALLTQMCCISHHSSVCFYGYWRIFHASKSRLFNNFPNANNCQVHIRFTTLSLSELNRSVQSTRQHCLDYVSDDFGL